MSIKRMIDQMEEKFFLEEVRDPRFLILTPESFHELSNEEGIDYKDSLDDFTFYNGLIVCVTTYPGAKYVEIVWVREEDS